MFEPDSGEEELKPRFAGLTREQLEEKYKPSAKVEANVGETKVEFSVFDFREGENPNIETLVYFDGFAQQERITNIESALVERAKKGKGVLVMPRTPVLPPFRDEKSPPNVKYDSSIDARMVHQAFLSQATQEKMSILRPIDIQNAKNLTIASWSDGGRTAIEFANLIDKNSPGVENGSRKLLLLSMVGAVDMVDDTRKADGTTLAKAFSGQTTDIIFEESRLRFNTEVFAKDEQGSSPLSRMGFDVIPGGSTKAEITEEIAKLGKTEEGRQIFMKQFNIALDKNLRLLADVLGRGLSSGKTTIEKVKNFFGNLAKSEQRSQACNGLKSFDVIMAIPRADTITPSQMLGRQIRKNAREFSQAVEPSLSAALEECKTDQELGNWFLTGSKTEIKASDASNKPELPRERTEAKVFFPNAKSTRMKILGELVTSPESSSVTGIVSKIAEDRTAAFSIVSTHVGPITNPELFLATLDDQKESTPIPVDLSRASLDVYS